MRGSSCRRLPAAALRGLANVFSPPALWTQLAVEETRALASYVEGDLVERVQAQWPGTSAAELSAAATGLAGTLSEHADWLESDLLPRSTGDFRLGRYLLQRKVLYEEHMALTVEELSRLNQQAIAEYRERLDSVATTVDPGRPPSAILDSLMAFHPTPEALVDSAGSVMNDLREWVEERELVTLPDQPVPVVRESPPYIMNRFAYLDGAGPFASRPVSASYNLTNVLPAWDEAEREGYLRYFNRPALSAITASTTFPGRYVQLGFEREVESPVRRLFTPSSFVEGWAHYTEALLVEEEFGGGDPALHLIQLQRSLQHHALWHAVLQLHAFGTPLEEVVQSFMEIAHVPEAIARREVVRATADAGRLYPALGRMQILELREDYRAYLEDQEEPYSLRRFHDDLLQLALPLPLVREAMIPSRSQRRRGG